MTAHALSAQAESIVRGDIRAAARAISRIEAMDPASVPLVAELFTRGRSTPTIGITGPPGAGKSTLVNHLLGAWRRRGERIAVLAIDPSSPFSGGAVLGDRVRMSRHATDAGVFIRSMASRQRLGGLSAATGDALIVLDAMGFDRLLIETVGVGQNEVDILHHADTVVVVQTPGAGDIVQAVKAGLLEIGDVLVLNKGDAAGAGIALSALREALEGQQRYHAVAAWPPTLLRTQALQGEGIDALVTAIDAHRTHLQCHVQQRDERRRRQLRALLSARTVEALSSRLRDPVQEATFERLIDEVLARRCDPASAACRLLASWP